MKGCHMRWTRRVAIEDKLLREYDELLTARLRARRRGWSDWRTGRPRRRDLVTAITVDDRFSVDQVAAGEDMPSER